MRCDCGRDDWTCDEYGGRHIKKPQAIRTAAIKLIEVANRHVASFDERSHNVLGLSELKTAADELKQAMEVE
jgi:hypothetical protein